MTDKPLTLGREEELQKLHCAIWLQSCSRTHALWCKCGVWTSHIRGWRPTEGDDGDVVGDPRDGGSVKVDAFGNIVDPEPHDDDG
nr:ORF2 [Torque teno felis virus]